MVGTVMATWLLVVKLNSPTQPQEAQLWNMNYRNASAESCEALAKTIWHKYNIRYGETMTPWMQTFTTTCSASEHKTEYVWFIKCDQLDNCTTQKYTGPKH